MNATMEAPPREGVTWGKIILISLAALAALVVVIGIVAHAFYHTDEKPLFDQRTDVSAEPEAKAQFCTSAIPGDQPGTGGMLMETRVGNQAYWIAIIPDKAPTTELADLAQRISGEVHSDPTAASLDALAYDIQARAACR